LEDKKEVQDIKKERKTLAVFGYTSLIIACIFLGIVFTIAMILALIAFFTAVDPTIITFIVSAALAATIYILTKRYEYKLFNAKETRENKLEIFQEYGKFLLEQRLQSVFNQKELQDYHIKLLFIVSNSSITKMNELVRALRKNKQKKVEGCIKK